MENTAVGFRALRSNTSGASNTAIGYQALQNNTMGFGNTANGVQALFSNNTGQANTAVGFQALLNNTATSNTAIGDSALSSNDTGSENTATGRNALLNNDTGDNNTANGLNALFNNDTGDNNTANGRAALGNNTTGSNNIALGLSAGIELTTGDFNIDIGNVGVAGEANTIRMGTSGPNGQTRTFIAGIRGATVGGNAIAVVIDSDGQLGTTVSSKRFKKEIRPMDDASKAILALKPVTFQYKSDAAETPQFGLIAEEVAEINPDLVVRDENGEIYTVRYDAVNAMLLNEFLKEHEAFLEQQCKVQEQEATTIALESKMEKQEVIIAQQQAKMETVLARLNEQTAQIQKVSAQVHLDKSVTKVAEAGR
jgi:hypothetical protein